MNSGTTATTPGDKGPGSGQQDDKSTFDVNKILQDIPGLSSNFSGGANSNNIQDVLKALNGGGDSTN